MLGTFAEQALIIIETRKSEQLVFPEDLVCLDERRYGMASVYFCQYR